MRSFVVSLLVTVLLFVGFAVGIFSQTPGLMFAWLCVSPFAFFALGRTSHNLLRGRRIAVVHPQELQAIRRHRVGATR